jgi:hypothetical protein
MRKGQCYSPLYKARRDAFFCVVLRRMPPEYAPVSYAGRVCYNRAYRDSPPGHILSQAHYSAALADTLALLPHTRNRCVGYSPNALAHQLAPRKIVRDSA